MYEQIVLLTRLEQESILKTTNGNEASRNCVLQNVPVLKGISSMSTHCPSCGAPVTEDSRFCSHCGTKLPENVQRIEIQAHNTTEIKIEDAAKLEEVRLRYELEGKKLQDRMETKRQGIKPHKTKCTIALLLSIVFLCISLLVSKGNENLSTVFGILFMASGIYGIYSGGVYLIKNIFKKS